MYSQIYKPKEEATKVFRRGCKFSKPRYMVQGKVLNQSGFLESSRSSRTELLCSYNCSAACYGQKTSYLFKQSIPAHRLHAPALLIYLPTRIVLKLREIGDGFFLSVQVIEELSSGSVLTTEFVPGVHIDKVRPRGILGFPDHRVLNKFWGFVAELSYSFN